MKILVEDKILISDCAIAKTFWQKLLGRLVINKPLLLLNCNSVHTIFLNKKLDLIFLSHENKIIKIIENLPNNCIIFPIKKVQNILETDAGFVKNVKIKVGDYLVFEE